MKIRYFLLLLSTVVLFCVLPVQAALPKPVWQRGQLTLWDKTLLEGDLSYNWLMETVLFRQPNGQVRTFSSNQVSDFGWFDFSNHTYRTFKVLASDETKTAIRHSFFEVCMDGSLVVVRKLKKPHGLFKRAFSHPTYFTDQPEMAQSLDYFNYYVYDAGHLLTLDRFYLDIYHPLMRAYDKVLQHYIEVHNINDRALLGRLLLIDRYNTLVEQDAKTASARNRVVAPE
ncbi:hypothetical protein GO730_14110 [Spirosoma sp. HMF3257]|uniref:Uncharacterized protein n=1 Tax=Spirosoma telluris TaxID=2183553 RepID=A0A327NJV6_9BACT|nr:hypothetical protein [Spirosoma telluris]RAI75055.1 hypothetical protein HMF3257_14035 [Spirosoma telluris]